MRRYRGSSGLERRAERRAQLIDAAIEVYGEAGHAHATVRRICQAAGLSERYFYESFANGEELFAAAFDQVVHIFISEQDVEGRTPPQGALLANYFEALRSHPVHSRVFLLEGPASGGPIMHRFEDAMAVFGRMLAGLSPTDPVEGTRRVLLVGVAGGLFHMGRLWITEQFATPCEQMIESAERLCQPIRKP